MFRIGTTELLLLLAIVLVIFGPSKLPQLGKAMGETLRSFKKGATGEEKSTAAENKEL